MNSEDVKVGDPDNRRNLKGVGLLEAIRQRPGMFLGECSLSGLWHFLHGYYEALCVYEITPRDYLLPGDFHDWVAYRLHFKASTSGWRNMILNRVGSDESAAFDRFFELLDQHGKRTPHLVAEISGYNKQYTVSELTGGGLWDERIVSYPKVIRLITFTEDPGFFIVSDVENDNFPARGFCPSLESFRTRIKVSPDQLKILDTGIYTRLIEEDSRCDRNDS